MTPHIKLQKKLEERLPKGGPSGCAGTYIQLTKKMGIKLFNCDYRSRYNALRMGMKEVAEEAKLAKKARKLYKNIPKCYGVKIFLIKERYHIGILFQHLGDKMARNIRYEDHRDREGIVGKLNDQLSKRGICHWDLHDKNIMFFKGRWWVIDMYSVVIGKPS